MTNMNALLSDRCSEATPIFLWNIGRKNLPGLFVSMGYVMGAEIGVWKGKFSEALCKPNAALQLICVDPWRPYTAYDDSKMSGDFEGAYRDAQSRLAPYGCTLDRRPSLEAVRDVDDASLDFVYIDANHSKQSVLDDLAAWTPKVRKGGVIAGHDYIRDPRKPFIQVADAVDEFTAERQIAPWFVLAGDGTPSFLWVVA